MKRIDKISGLVLLLLMQVNLHAQTPYFYYYKGEKQYLELNTSYVFISAADENAVGQAASLLNARQSEPLRTDVQEGSRTGRNRFWTTLSFDERLSDEAYLSRLSEIRNTGKDVIVAPCFQKCYKCDF